MKTISTREFQLHLKDYIDGVEDLTLTKRDKVVGYFLHDLPVIHSGPTLPTTTVTGTMPPENTPSVVMSRTMPTENILNVMDGKPLDTAITGWCQVNAAHPMMPNVNFTIKKITWEDEEGRPLLESKWACPKCIEHYQNIGRGKVYFL